MKVFIIVLTIWSAGLTNGQGVSCPALNTHCLCKNRVIDCTGHSLTSVPIFRTISSGSFVLLLLSNNNITNVPANAFSALNVTSIQLDNNQISVVDPSAFTGILNFLKILNLANNNLNKLPEALQNVNLDTLDVSWNPIPGYRKRPHGPGTDGLTDSVMRHLGSTLIKFAFGDSTLTTWPRSLSHLNQLQELRVSGANITYLPSNAFHGFEQTLIKLTIEYASLAAVPLAISVLRRIEELHLDHLDVPGRDGVTVMFGDMAMTAAPFGPIADTLRILSLEHDGLTTFPEVISELRALQNISLTGNNLEFISDEAIELLKNSEVTILILENCNLKRIPGSISDLAKLRILDFSRNQIRSIESTDLQNLQNLKLLSLGGNPLRYISDDSLCGLNNLTELNLRGSNLTLLSQSLKNLERLETLDLRDAKIDCTCDITWFKKWLDFRHTCTGRSGENRNLTILGNCETINQGIMPYINDRLTRCPDYFVPSNITCHGSCTTRR